MPDKDPVVERLSLEVLALRNIVQMLIAYGNVPTGGKLNKYLEKLRKKLNTVTGAKPIKPLPM